MQVLLIKCENNCIESSSYICQWCTCKCPRPPNISLLIAKQLHEGRNEDKKENVEKLAKDQYRESSN